MSNITIPSEIASKDSPFMSGVEHYMRDKGHIRDNQELVEITIKHQVGDLPQVTSYTTSLR